MCRMKVTTNLIHATHDDNILLDCPLFQYHANQHYLQPHKGSQPNFHSVNHYLSLVMANCHRSPDTDP